MPASNEIVANRPLSGTELRNIILRDVDNMLSRDGMFTPHIGYGRAAYEIVIKLHLDNPGYPHHDVVVQSREPAKGDTSTTADVHKPPLQNPSEDSVVAGMERTRNIDSPNLARLELELPITVQVRDGQSGAMVDQQVTYSNEGLEHKTEMRDKDVTEKIAEGWGL